MKITFKVLAVNPTANTLTVQLYHPETNVAIGGSISYAAANLSQNSLAGFVVGQTYNANIVRYL